MWICLCSITKRVDKTGSQTTAIYTIVSAVCRVYANRMALNYLTEFIENYWIWKVENCTRLSDLIRLPKLPLDTHWAQIVPRNNTTHNKIASQYLNKLDLQLKWFNVKNGMKFKQERDKSWMEDIERLEPNQNHLRYAKKYNRSTYLKWSTSRRKVISVSRTPSRVQWQMQRTTLIQTFFLCSTLACGSVFKVFVLTKRK